MSQNTLFNYFQKSPSAQTTPPGSRKTPSKTSKSNKTSSSVLKAKNDNQQKTPTRQNGTPKSAIKGKRKEKIIEDDEELGDESPDSKRRKVEESDDSGDDFVPGNESDSESEASPEPSSEEDPSDEDEEDIESIQKSQKRGRNTPSQTPRRRASNTTPRSGKGKSVGLPSTSKGNTGSASASKTGMMGEPRGASSDWPHLKLAFLQKENLRDKKGRPSSHPDYDEKTLYIPDDYKRELTPAVRQWWEVKANLFDCVLFFKLGKFYELYHMDAVIGMEVLNLTAMRGEFAHVGFPEPAYPRYAAMLVGRGFKVARIEQTETPDTMNERVKKMHKATKFDKVVKREICQVTTPGVRTFSVLDGECRSAKNLYLLAVAEKNEDNKNIEYGVCFVDAAIGLFHVGQFTDDRHASRLRTLIAHHPPSQILHERKRISPQLQEFFKRGVSTALKEPLNPDSEFWSASKTLRHLSETEYFSSSEYPIELKQFIRETSQSAPLSADSHCELGIKALGAVVFYLSRCQVDHQLLSMARFSVYKPVDEMSNELDKKSQSAEILNKNLILDATTLKNLTVVEDERGGTKGTLLEKLDNCSTLFGKRLLHQWICSPLTCVNSIKARQQAIKVVLDEPQIIGDVRKGLKDLPDLERSFTKIYSQSSKGLKSSHPDARAILFEEGIYSKRKISEFVATINGFDKIQKLMTNLQNSGIGNSSDLLKTCCCHPNAESDMSGGRFYDLSEHIQFFKTAFNHDEAKKLGRIIPSPGVEPEYDQTELEIKEIEKEADNYLREQCRYFGCKVNFFGADKKRFQLEVPEAQSRKAGDGYDFQGRRKGFARYWTSECRDFVSKIIQAEDRKTKILGNIRQNLFAKFCERAEFWNAAIECTAVLDVLVSLAEYARTEDTICVPQFFTPQEDEQPFVRVTEGIYPCKTLNNDVFIPNSITLGDGPHIILLTGPNMGGKSTLMRQLGLAIIMAQIGCHVPAENLELNPVDRIFTRIGARDNIMMGESTFFVELSETASILHHATMHSLALIDELGRGTSTHDGTAIAFGVLKGLCSMKCRTIFSTHYHSLVDDFKRVPSIWLGHMTCMVENDSDDISEEKVTFLYKLGPGACPKSYGFNAARLAGVPLHVLKRAREIADMLESKSNRRKSTLALLQGSLDFNSFLDSIS